MAVAGKKGSPVPLIIFIVLFVFATAGLVLVVLEYVKVHEQANRGFNPSQEPRVNGLIRQYTDGAGGLKIALLKADDQRRVEALKLEKLGQVVGGRDPEAIEEQRRQVLDRVGLVQDGGGEAGPADARTLIGLVLVLEKEKLLLAERLREQKRVGEAQAARLAARAEAAEAQVREKQTAIDQRDAELQTVRRQMEQERGRAQEEARMLRDSLGRSNSEREMIENSLRQEVLKRDKVIADLKKQNEILREKGFAKEGTEFAPETEPVDGKVLLVDRETGVVVDIGRKQGIRRGLRFQVYTEKPDGTRVLRGEIEIKTVEPEISRGILLGGLNPVNIIHKEDILINPAFDPGRAKVFVADTTFNAARKEALRVALADYGSVLEEEITIRTDYLIVGAQKGRLVDEAQKFGVTMIRVTDLDDFLGRR